MTKTITISMGDPAGIGPEITCKALAKLATSGNKFIIAGDRRILEDTCLALDLDPALLTGVEIINPYTPAEPVLPGKLSGEYGKAAYHYIVTAAKLVQTGKADAMVTGPINKEALHLGGLKYAGHTEILAEICGVKNYSMFLSGAGLNVFHVSTHVSILEACRRVKTQRVLDVISLAMETLTKLGHENPRLAVSGLNPHAGENGLFGTEEIEEIIPAITKARDRGWDVRGPEPPDTVFLAAHKGKFDGVIAMYHDQGHIPLKMLGFDEGVNTTVGLPIIRTSVDHGTAFDIAGKGLASEASMIKAIEMAILLA